MDLGGGPFAGVAQTLVRLMVQVASAAVGVIVAWKMLGVIFSGGSDRAVKGLVRDLLIIGVAVAALANPGAALAVVAAAGALLWSAVSDALRSGAV